MLVCYFTGCVISFKPEIDALSCLTYRQNTDLEMKNMELEVAFFTIKFNISFNIYLFLVSMTSGLGGLEKGVCNLWSVRPT